MGDKEMTVAQDSVKGDILLIDDNPDNLKLLAQILTENGFQVRASDSGGYALKSIKKDPPDLILLDVKMPEMDGYEVCRQLKADRLLINIPVIFISALKEEESKVKGFEVGGVDYITKPFHSQEILARVSTHLSMSRMQHHSDQLVSERTQALRESEEKYRLLVETSRDLIWKCDAESRFTYLNPAWETLLGYKIDEMIDRPFSEFKPPEVAENDLKTFQKIIGGADAFGYETVYLTKSGEEKNLVFNALRFRDPDGTITGTQGTAFDITERKQAEESLQQSEKKFRALFEQAGDYILLLEVTEDKGLVIVDANQAACEIHGYTREEFLDTPISDLDRGLGEEHVRTLVDRVMSGESLLFETAHVKKDGTIFPIEVSAKLLDVGEDPSHVIAIERDITDRKQAEEKLDWELRVNKTLAELANTLIAPDQSIKEVAEKVLASAKGLTGSEHGYVSEIDRVSGENVSHTLTAMMGEACKVTGPDQRIVFPRGDDGQYGKLWGHALNTGESFFTNSPQDHPKFSGLPEGHVQFTRFLSVPVKYSGEVIGQITLANPLSDYAKRHVEAIQRLANLYALAIHRHRSEEDGIRMEDQLREAHKMEAIGTLTGGIAHDFNNILASIIGYSELAAMDLQDGHPSKKNLEQIFVAGERAKKLVQQMLSFARPTNLERRPIKLDLTVRETLAFIRATLPTTIEIKENIETDLDHTLADPTQIHQVLMNLCTNAGYAMRINGGILQVGLTQFELIEENVTLPGLRPGKYLKLYVTDTGPGMESETLGRIFEPFFTTKGPGEGTGMGLSVVHGIVTGHDGIIIANSELGQGASFEIYLPQIEVEVEDQLSPKPGSFPTGTERILFVDDESAIAALGRKILKQLGYQVTSLTSSQEALELFNEHSDEFDLIITDMTMPHITGLDLVKKVLRTCPDMPIILCTGHSERFTHEDILELGIKKIMLKPFNINEMAVTVRAVLDENA